MEVDYGDWLSSPEKRPAMGVLGKHSCIHMLIIIYDANISYDHY